MPIFASQPTSHPAHPARPRAPRDPQNALRRWKATIDKAGDSRREALGTYELAVKWTVGWMEQHQAAEPLADVPRSTHRVSYSTGGQYTETSSPAPAGACAEQSHTHIYTEPSTGQRFTQTAKCNAQHKNTWKLVFVKPDGSIKVHAHTFNDPSAQPATGKPMGLFVDPNADKRSVRSIVMTPLAGEMKKVSAQQLAAEGEVMLRVRREIGKENQARRANLAPTGD